MNYFYFEFFVGILLLISLLFYLSPSLINLLAVMIVLLVLINCNTDPNQNSWDLIVKLFILGIGVSIYNFLQPKIISSAGVLLLSIILASLLIVSANNLLALYIAIELQSLSLFIMIAKERSSINKVEAALKYFVLSSISSGIFLMGTAIFFCNYGTCNIYDLSIDYISIGKILIIAALLFKLAAAPLHVWVPDVYQGCDYNSLIILGTLPKISILVVLINLLPNNKVVLITVIFSLIIGCIGVINQTNIKKLLAYSGIINMGFILLGVSTNSFVGVESSIIYLLIYSITFLCFIILVDLFTSKKDSISEFSSFLGINKTVLVTIVFLMFSFAGIPPFAGFFIKWMVLANAISSQFIFTSLISIICAIIAGVYYVRIVKISYFQIDKSYYMWKEALIGKREVNYNKSIILGLTLFLIISLTIYPNLILSIVHLGTLSIY